MIAALIGQGLSAEHAMLYAVYLHGAAADPCVANGVGPHGDHFERSHRFSTTRYQYLGRSLIIN
ncbi:MAG: hypothetical protein ABIW48_04845, partial [Burkholderiales bacterium]